MPPTQAQHAARFDHDPQAATYDLHVADGSNPIRAGYDAVLAAVATASTLAPPGLRVELGVGTGNLALRLPPGPLLALDRSRRMLAVAADKLSDRPDTTLLEDDLLAFALERAPRAAAFLSTYALHHLTDPEKRALLGALAARLEPGGLLAVGDLMFERPASKAEILASHPELVADVEDEFFWDLSLAHAWLDELGLSVQIQRFSLLSWVFVATKVR